MTIKKITLTKCEEDFKKTLHDRIGEIWRNESVYLLEDQIGKRDNRYQDARKILRDFENEPTLCANVIKKLSDIIYSYYLTLNSLTQTVINPDEFFVWIQESVFKFIRRNLIKNIVSFIKQSSYADNKVIRFLEDEVDPYDNDITCKMINKDLINELYGSLIDKIIEISYDKQDADDLLDLLKRKMPVEKFNGNMKLFNETNSFKVTERDYSVLQAIIFEVTMRDLLVAIHDLITSDSSECRNLSKDTFNNICDEIKALDKVTRKYIASSKEKEVKTPQKEEPQNPKSGFRYNEQKDNNMNSKWNGLRRDRKDESVRNTYQYNKNDRRSSARDIKIDNDRMYDMLIKRTSEILNTGGICKAYYILQNSGMTPEEENNFASELNSLHDMLRMIYDDRYIRKVDSYDIRFCIMELFRNNGKELSSEDWETLYSVTATENRETVNALFNINSNRSRYRESR